MTDRMEDIPRVAFFDAIARGREQATVRGMTPTSVEVRYGEGALDSIQREELRKMASVDKAFGLPVTFPEEPAPRPRLVEFTVRCAEGGVRFAVAPEEFNYPE